MKFLIYLIIGVALIALIEAKKNHSGRRNRTGRHNRTSHPKWKNHISQKKLEFKNENEEIKAY